MSAWLLSGKTKLAKGETQEALADFQRAVSLQPDHQGAQLAIVDAYRQTKEPLRALTAVEQFLSKFPPDQQPESALLAKSTALIELHQLTPAIELLQVASHREGVSSEVFLRLGQAQLLAGQGSQARLTLSKAKQICPNDSSFESLLGQLPTSDERVASLDASLR